MITDPQKHTPRLQEVRMTYVVGGPGNARLAEFDRWLRSVQAAAWDEGAVWAAEECGAIRHPRHPFLVPGDNPYQDASDTAPYEGDPYEVPVGGTS